MYTAGDGLAQLRRKSDGATGW